jgi:hypothetical protein
VCPGWTWSRARLSHLWKVDEEGACVREIRRDGWAMSVWLEWPPPPRHELPRREIWTYDLPSLFLRRRQEIETDEGTPWAGAISANGELAEWRVWRAGPAGAKARIWFSRAWWELPICGRGNFANILGLTRDWAVLSAGDSRDATVYILDCAGRKVRARIDLLGAGPGTRARIQGERLLVYDPCGRLLLLSLKSGAVLQEHRLA